MRLRCFCNDIKGSRYFVFTFGCHSRRLGAVTGKFMFQDQNIIMDNEGLQQNTHQSIKVHPVRRLSLNSGLWRDWADNEKPWCSTRASTCWKDHQVQALLQALLVRPQLKVAIPHLYEQAYVEPSTDMPWCGLDLKFVSLRVRLEDVQLADCQSAGFHHLKMDSLPLVFIQPARLAYLIRFT